MTKKRQIEIKNEYLKLISDLAYDYDGYNTVENLKGLIDEIVELANKAYHNDDKSIIYTSEIKNYNILHEEIKDERK